MFKLARHMSNFQSDLIFESEVGIFDFVEYIRDTYWKLLPKPFGVWLFMNKETSSKPDFKYESGEDNCFYLKEPLFENDEAVVFLSNFKIEKGELRILKHEDTIDYHVFMLKIIINE